MLSATYDSYHQKLLKQVFNIDTKDIVDQESKLEIQRGHKIDPFQLDQVVKDTEDELRECIYQEIGEFLFDKPFIVFEDVADVDLRERV